MTPLTLSLYGTGLALAALAAIYLPALRN